MTAWLRNHNGGAKKITGREKWEFSPFQNRHIEHIPFPGELVGMDENLIKELERVRCLADSNKISEAKRMYFELITETRNVNAKNDFAKFLYRIGLKHKAEEEFKEIRQFALEKTYLGRKSRAEANLAIIARSLGNVKDAQDYLEQSLKTNRQFNHQPGIADNLRQLSSLKRMRGERKGGSAGCEYALKLFEELQYKPGIADTYSDLGVICRIRCEYEQALAYYKRSLELNQELNRPGCVADVLGRKGSLSRITGDLKTSFKLHAKANKINLSLERKHGIAEDWGHFGMTLLDRENYDCARKYLSKAEQLSRELNNKEMLAKHLAGFGKLLLMEPTDKAKRNDVLLQANSYLSEAMELNESMGAKEGIAMVSQLFAEYILQQPRVKFMDAEGHVQRAKGLWEDMGNPLGIAECLETLGLIRERMGNVDEAMEMCRKSVKMSHVIGARMSELSARIRLCSVLKLSNNLAQAKIEYDLARKLGKEIGAIKKVKRLDSYMQN